MNGYNLVSIFNDWSDRFRLGPIGYQQLDFLPLRQMSAEIRLPIKHAVVSGLT